MAESLKEGISREFRYMEYKFRKRRSDRDKKDKKHNQSTNNYPKSNIHPDPNISPEMKGALPSSAGEEDLQLQVALAMSREEATEKEKTELSDKIRLDMALKESSKLSDHTTTKATSVVSSVQSTDPWGGASTTQSKQVTFDPFAQTATTSGNGFGDDAWGTTAFNTSNNGPQSSTDPWGSQSSNTAPGLLPPPAKTAPKKMDPWGATQQPLPQVADPWNASTATTSNAVADLSSGNIWGSPAPTSNDVYSKISKNDTTFNLSMQQNGAVFSPSNIFDPLQGFDQLALQSKQQSQPPMGFSGDLLSGDVLTPQPANTTTLVNQSGNNMPSQETAGTFLGENASLVNMKTLVTKPPATHPYITMNTSATGGAIASRNPFDQKPPSLSLNQMKGSTPTTFAGQAAPNLQATNGTFPTSIQPTALTLPPMGMHMQMSMAMQPTYGMPGATVNANPFAYSQQAQPNMFAAQPNQSLF